MSESIIIIGAGIAGLSAGCYGQMNGYKTRIFEMHDIPGGLCTAWERNGYTFEGCIHYLYGSAPGGPFNQLWQELGGIQGRKIINHSEFLRIQDLQGQTLIVYSDPDQLEEHMLEISPRDAQVIHSFCRGIRQFKDFDMSLLYQKPRSLFSPTDYLSLGIKMMPYLEPLLRWAFVSMDDFAKRFQHPFFRKAIAQMFGWQKIPVMAGLAQLAYINNGNAGFPAGGSLPFAQAVEDRYLTLGGRIEYKSQVEKILVEDGRTVGVRLYDDSIHYADYVISAADGRSTIFAMLSGEFTNKKIAQQYDGRHPLYPQMQISLGVNRDLSDIPHWIVHLLDQPVLIAGREYEQIGIKHYSFDPAFAPPGKSVVEVLLPTDFSYWQRIYGRKLYDTEQVQVANLVTAELEKVIPGIQQDIEVVDVATPLTYERYTGNWQGSTCGWLLTPQTMKLNLTGLSKTLPGLDNFYMAGQWVEPGGMLPLAAMSGRNTIHTICNRDGKAFKTSIPGMFAREESPRFGSRRE